MKKYFLFVIVLCLGIVISNAKKIESYEALELAKQLPGKHNAARSIDLNDGWEITLLRNQVYVINKPEGGWVLVSADDRVPQMILGYSNAGHINPMNMPVALEGIINGYANGLEVMETSTDLKVVALTRSTGNVEPLLGDIAWDQSYPYNAMFPIFGEYQNNAGCVQIAQGQLMYYYQYPANGRGSNSFESDGITYSMDFSKSVYQWDQMKPYYVGSEDKSSIEAVAKLIYDIAIANCAYFGNVLTPASLNEPGLVEYFKYDPGIIMVNSDKCTREYLENLMRENIDNGNPLYIQGINEYGGGHAFLCDGYNEEGYFHYNMGGATGYFLSTATGYDVEQYVYCGIKPDEGGKPTLWAGSQKEFYWKGGDTLICDVWTNCLVSNQGDVEVALALEDKNGNIQYFTKYQNSYYLIKLETLIFDDKINDGEYILYPVYRTNGDNWIKINFPENAADHVIVEVKDGKKTYINTSTGGVIDPGVILIDDVYYRINDNEAIVTSRNNLYNSYSGDVIIPAEITYEETMYPVTKIDNSAFKDSQINTVYIGENINTIGSNAFYNTEVGAIVYENEDNVKTIEERAFIFCHIEELRIPSGVTYLPYIFSLGGSKTIDIPSSVNHLAVMALNNEEEILRDVYIHWPSDNDLPYYDFDKINNYGPLFGDYKNVTLHVPEGCAELYRNHKVWGVFGRIDEGNAGIGNIHESQDMDISIVNGTVRINALPEGETVNVYNLQGELMAKAKNGNTIILPKGIYLLQRGKDLMKVIL